jgi:hypothetical protein
VVKARGATSAGFLVALIGACAAPTGQPPTIPDGAAAQDVAPPSSGVVFCPLTRDSGSGKIPDAERAQFARTAGPIPVLIMVAGGAVISPLPGCDQRPCPANEAIVARWTAENLASQLCVRQLITALGGSSDPTSFWITNSFGAALTWAQIQQVATHPHVKLIEAQQTTIPPP